jgi:hypothetical protein
MFGNGFTQRLDICLPPNRVRGHRFRSEGDDHEAVRRHIREGKYSQIACWRHARLETSVCEWRNVVIDEAKFKMAEGGESITQA